MFKPSYIFDLCETSKLDTKALKSIGFIVESGILDYNLLKNLNPCHSDQTVMNDTDMLIDEYLANENQTVESPVVSTTTITRPIVVSADSDNNKVFEKLSAYDRIYDLIEGKGISKSKLTFLAQILNIYDLQMQLLCTKCSRMFNTCKCENKNSLRIELNAKFLIDDHTGVLKVNYKNGNYCLNDKQFSLFGVISQFLLELLKIFGHLRLDSIPICTKYGENVAFSEIISRKLSNNDLNKDQIDFMKVVHDFLFYSVLNKYFQFHVPLNNFVVNYLKKLNMNCLHDLKENHENDKIFKNTINVECSNIASFGSVFQF
jgi:hypothetical protein